MKNFTINLKKLTNEELDCSLKNLIRKEREVLSEIITHIIEVDTRRLFLNYAYPNLFEYLTKHVGYSSGSAQRRIVAARLAQKVPEVVTQIEQGNLNLSQVNLIHQSIRQAELQSTVQHSAPQASADSTAAPAPTRKVSTEEKKALVVEISKKFQQETCPRLKF